MSKAQHTYTATLPTGEVKTTKSTRVYTHAIYVGPDADGERGGICKMTANPAAAMANPGQSAAQSRYFRSRGITLIELAVIA